MAVQPGAQVHRPLPRDARDLVATARGYGGNALLGKKCFALRIASVMARDEGWLAEHMLILGVDAPDGREDLRRGGVPERLRQDQLRDADPARRASRAGRSRPSATTSPGSSRDDDGRFYAINPGGRLSSASRRAPRTSRTRTRWRSLTRERDLHQRRADRRRRRLVGGDDRGAAGAPHRLAGAVVDARTAGARRRTRTRASPCRRSQCPSLDPRLGEPGRRADRRLHLRRPAQRHACRWSSRRSTGRTASTWRRRWARRRRPRPTGKVGEVRRDPFAMLPFCGYHMGDYFDALAEDGHGGAASRRGSSASTGSARTRTASSSGPASARTCACWHGSSSAATAAATRCETPLGLEPDYEDLNWTRARLPARAVRAGDAGRPRAVEARAGGARRAVREARRASARRRWPPSASGSAPASRCKRPLSGSHVSGAARRSRSG